MTAAGRRTTLAAVARGAALALFTSLAACDCGRDASPPPLATLAALHGDAVSRDFAARREQWERAQLGAAFRFGDGLQTQAASTALLRLVDGSKLHVEPDTTIRFLGDGGGDGEQGIDVLTGEALLSAGARDLKLRTHVGLAVIQTGGRVRLVRARDGLDLRVEVGEARFRAKDGADVQLSAGDDVRLQVGMAVLRAVGAAQAGATPVAVAADAGATAVATQDVGDAAAPGANRLGGSAEPGPDYANFGARAGESFVVHAPELPVAVAFEFGQKCKDEGVLELARSKQRARGKGSANLLFSAGASGYTLRCLEADGDASRVVARGTVHVLHDAGTRRLPPRAPTSEVDADGRTYTIYYQNQLPDVRVRWPNAPSASSYRLDVDGKPMALRAPEHLFRSGSLRDGVHRLTFEAGGRRSRTANVAVRFDNAAPTASLIAPADRSFAPGAAVTVEGLSLPGWKVSVQGGTIDRDDDDRFEGQVMTSAQRPDVAVRLSHPRRGTHYYLRRAQGSR